MELFELFIRNDILKAAKTEMTKYCLTKNWANINVSITKLKVFIAALIISANNDCNGQTLQTPTMEQLKILCAEKKIHFYHIFTDNVFITIHLQTKTKNLYKSYNHIT